MKSILFTLAILFLIAEGYAQNFASVRKSQIQLRGVLSSDTENVKREADPMFISKLTQKRFTGKGLPGQTQQLRAMPNGMNIMKDALNDLVAQEYKFQLLSGHKYMINDCLGLKVSAGEFQIKFKNPFVGDDPLGFKIRLEVEKISLNVIKIRTKPRVPDFSDPNPCHFSGKFEISGEARDLSMTAYVNPIGSTGAPVFCLTGYSDAPKLDWNMNALKLLDFANSLDAVGREMVYDGLDFGMQNLLMDKFIDLMKKAIKKYYQLCDEVYWQGYDLLWYSGANGRTTYDAVYGSEAMNAKTAVSQDEQSTDQWVMKPEQSMKGALGRLNTDFGADVDWIIDIRTTEDKFITNKSKVNKITHHDLAPGMYYFRLNTITVKDVPIEKGKETRLKAGILNIVSEGRWEIRSEDKSKFHTTGNKPKKMALPVGSYQLKLGEQFFPLVIKDRETVEM